jgi:hypothetical protein
VTVGVDLFGERMWSQVRRSDVSAREMADRHYSRQTPGAAEFCPPGRTFVLLGDACVWAAVENLDAVGVRRWRVSIFRREPACPHVASDLVREATRLTIARWARRWPGHGLRLTTEVDPARTRRKRDPGRCFRRAGWVEIEPTAGGLIRLAAPEAL